MLHLAYQNNGIEPGILMGLRTSEIPISEGERTFIFASVLKALEDGYTPVKVANFMKKGEG